MKYWQTPTFRALEAEWYEKLKDAGFQDIEGRLSNDQEFLHQWSSRFSKQLNKAEYFALMLQAVAEEPWVNSADQLIMTRRSEGVKIKDISSELASLGLKFHRQTIRFVIRRFETKWGIRHWDPHELTRYIPKAQRAG